MRPIRRWTDELPTPSQPHPRPVTALRSSAMELKYLIPIIVSIIATAVTVVGVVVAVRAQSAPKTSAKADADMRDIEQERRREEKHAHRQEADEKRAEAAAARQAKIEIDVPRTNQLRFTNTGKFAARNITRTVTSAQPGRQDPRWYGDQIFETLEPGHSVVWDWAGPGDAATQVNVEVDWSDAAGPGHASSHGLDMWVFPDRT